MKNLQLNVMQDRQIGFVFEIQFDGGNLFAYSMRELVNQLFLIYKIDCRRFLFSGDQKN